MFYSPEIPCISVFRIENFMSVLIPYQTDRKTLRNIEKKNISTRNTLFLLFLFIMERNAKEKYLLVVMISFSSSFLKYCIIKK